MKALVLEAYNDLRYLDVPEPELGADDVLVSVRACGICGSDIHGMDGSTGRRRPPIIMGHEAAGVIARVGDSVRDWQAGDRVTFDSTVYCGDCDYCRAGRVNLCDNRRVIGVSCEDYRRHGAFAELVVVPHRVLYRLPDYVSFAQAAFVEPVSIAVHAVRRANVQAGETAVVIGTGMIGLLVVQMLRAVKAGTIIAVDTDPAKLVLAQSMGAQRTVLAGDFDSPAANVDHAFEVVGVSATVDAAVKAVRKGGSVTLVGNLSPSVTFPLQAAVTRELTIYGSCASNGEYPEALERIAKGDIDVSALTSAVAPLAEGADWFRRLYNKEDGLIKVILQPGEGSIA